jgi:uncharacterized delta-60 repeat protein
MRLIVAAIIVFVVVGCSPCLAQRFIGPIGLDPEFPNNGKWEIDFEGRNDIPTALIATKNTSLIVSAKISSGPNGNIRFGMLRFYWEGFLDPHFGTNGKVDLAWGAVDYALHILPMWDTSTMCAGASRDLISGTAVFPTVYWLKTNGTPDSMFNKNGRAVFPRVTGAAGEFNRIDSVQVGANATTRFLGLGYSEVDPGSNTFGFYAARFDSSGVLDSAFGTGGKVFLPKPVHSVKGFKRTDLQGIFVGLADDATKPEIVLAKADLYETGTFDKTFGTDGLKHTGIFLHGGDTLLAELQRDDRLVVLAPIEDSSAHLPFTLMRFDLDGALDTTYGTNGFASAPVITRIASPGLTISNDGSAIVCGMEQTGLGQSIVTKFVVTGALDSTFGYAGIVNIDADSGLRKNFMVRMNSVGQKKFIGMGNTFSSPTNADLLIARYIPVSPPDTALTPAVNTGTVLSVYPNPANRFVWVKTENETIKAISFVDALGRTVRSFVHPESAARSDRYYFDLSDLPTGIYLCIVQTMNGAHLARLTVNH